MRTVEQAIQWTRDRGPIPDEHGNPVGAPGWCKRETRTAYAVPSDGSKNATEAWGRTKHKHTDGSVPPRGALVWWTGGRNGHGHVAISLGEGNIRSTDLPRSGSWGTVARSTPVKLWGLKYVGWSEDIDGVRVIEVKAKPAKRSQLANLRHKLERFANDESKGPARRRAARRAADELRGFQ